jgi:hypothetical protein
VTPDGRYLFRPWGQFGRAYELPDKAAYDRARLINYGLVVVVIVIVLGNLIHRQAWVTVLAAAVLLVGFFAWMLVEKRNWRVSDEP